MEESQQRFLELLPDDHTTSRGRHTCFQMTVLCNFCTCYYETHMVWSFDTFYNLTMTPMSKNKGIKTYVVEHFTIFKQETTLLKLLREFLSVLYRLTDYNMQNGMLCQFVVRMNKLFHHSRDCLCLLL
jgi:hypothetical protein